MLIVQQSAVDLAGARAAAFWNEFPAVKCTERVIQSRLREDGDVAASRTQEFDYVALLKKQSQSVSIEESRIARERRVEARDDLLLTSGFPALLLMFHPEFRSGFDFSPAGSDGSGLTPITFISRRDSHSMSALKVKDRLYPIYWQGTAWIDSETGAIVKIQARLHSSMSEVGVSDLEAEIQYGPVLLSGAYVWLPKRAEISLQGPRSRWRNVHEFSAYQLFSVTTTSRPQQPR